MSKLANLEEIINSLENTISELETEKTSKLAEVETSKIELAEILANQVKARDELSNIAERLKTARSEAETIILLAKRKAKQLVEEAELRNADKDMDIQSTKTKLIATEERLDKMTSDLVNQTRELGRKQVNFDTKSEEFDKKVIEIDKKVAGFKLREDIIADHFDFIGTEWGKMDRTTEEMKIISDAMIEERKKLEADSKVWEADNQIASDKLRDAEQLMREVKGQQATLTATTSEIEIARKELNKTKQLLNIREENLRVREIAVVAIEEKHRKNNHITI